MAGVSLLLVFATMIAACQSTLPPVADNAAGGKSVAVGDWTVRTSGYVRAEGGVVR